RTPKGGSKYHCRANKLLSNISNVYADLTHGASGANLWTILRQIFCHSGNDSSMIQRILYLLKIFASRHKLFLGAAQFAHIKKTCGVSAQTGTNCFDIEQMLDTIISIVM